MLHIRYVPVVVLVEAQSFALIVGRKKGRNNLQDFFKADFTTALHDK